MKQDSFFNFVKSWSRRKHRLLGKYLKPFSAKIGSWNSLIYCVDGFAGEGKYGDESDGSPLIMARLADECTQWQRPVTLRLINVESNTSHFRELCLHTRAWEDKQIVTNLPGDFCSLVPQIVSQIGEAPAFFFVDPYGPTYIHFSHLLPILNRRQRATELIINFDADGLRRLGDTVNAKIRTERAKKAVQTNIANVKGIVGGDQWLSEFAAKNLSTQEREKLLLDEYMRNLSRYNYNVAAYAIRKSVGHSPKYYLVFCTRHEDGIRLMNDFVRTEEDELLLESGSLPGQLRLPSDEFDILQQEIRSRRDELKELIIDYLMKTPKTTRGKIKHKLIFERFGDFQDKDYNAVVQELVNRGNLQTGHGRKRFNDDEELTYIPT